MDYPQTYQNEEGVQLIARDEVQAAAMEREGFEPIGKYTEKKRKTE